MIGKNFSKTGARGCDVNKSCVYEETQESLVLPPILCMIGSLWWENYGFEFLVFSDLQSAFSIACSRLEPMVCVRDSQCEPFDPSS